MNDIPGDEILRLKLEKIQAIPPQIPIRFARPVPSITENSMQRLVLNVTDACNLRCTYCVYSGQYSNERIHGTSVMDIDTALRSVALFLKHADQNGMRGIGFYGGEPTIALPIIQAVVDMVDHQKEPMFFSMTTNGFVWSLDAIRLFISRKFTLWVSLDGPKSSHDRYRLSGTDGSGSHNSVMRNLRVLRDLAPDYYRDHVGFVVTLAPPFCLPDIYDFYRNEELVNGHQMMINFINPLDTLFLNKVSQEGGNIAPESYQAQLKGIEGDFIETAVLGHAEKHFGWFVWGDLIRKIHNRSMATDEEVWPNGICDPGVGKLFVDTNGKFYPCERTGEFIPLGDIDRGIDVSASRDALAAYIDDCEEGCSNCSGVRFCNACFSATRRGNKFDFLRKYKYCSERIRQIENALRIYATVLEQNPTAFDMTRRKDFTASRS